MALNALAAAQMETEMKWPVVNLPDGSLHKLVRTSRHDMDQMKLNDLSGLPVYWCDDDVWPKPNDGWTVEYQEIA